MSCFVRIINVMGEKLRQKSMCYPNNESFISFAYKMSLKNYLKYISRHKGHIDSRVSDGK